MTTRDEAEPSDEADPSKLAEEAADLVVSAQHIATLANMEQAWEHINAVAEHLCRAADAKETPEEDHAQEGQP